MLEQLDSPEFVLRNDPKGMFGYTMGFPEQCRKALSIAEGSSLDNSLANKRNVVIAGMGGSAAGGDFTKALFDEHAKIPCSVIRDYELPQFVNHETLFIACSFSGNTEETIAATLQAKERGATILVVTSGGELADFAKENGAPLIQFPGGQPPRTALGFLFIPLAYACSSLGYFAKPDFEASFSLLDTCAQNWGIDSDGKTNPTKNLALHLFGAVPVIYGLGSWQGMVANRWRCQLNENAKIITVCNTFPELNHNEIMGWQLADQQGVAKWANVILESGDESKRMQTRASVTRQILNGKSESFTVTAKGDFLLSQMLTLTYFGDFVSLYLASLYGVDPETIDAINLLKNTLANLH